MLTKEQIEIRRQEIRKEYILPVLSNLADLNGYLRTNAVEEDIQEQICEIYKKFKSELCSSAIMLKVEHSKDNYYVK